MAAHVRPSMRSLALPLVHGFLGIAGLAVLAGVLVAARPAWATDDTKPSDKPPPEFAAGHGPGAEHEPTPIEHVMDSTDKWIFFHTFPWLEGFRLPRVFGYAITKFMILELISAGLILAIYIPLARRVQKGDPVKGWKDNAFEVLLTFIRDEVAKPSIGEHDADRFVPFLWTLFLFILFNNLLGIIPFAGSATASIYVTGALALVVFFAIHGSAIAKMGFGHYITSFWPHIEMHWAMGLPIKTLIFFIEIIGVLVRNAVLAVRLFANMFAGHMVLATILIFIWVARNAGALWYPITFASILGIVALSLLEIFVAFLQAYIFVFLAALFMGMAMHPQH